MAAKTATDRCLAIPEMIHRIVSFLDRNDLISCIGINSTWNEHSLRLFYSMAFAHEEVLGAGRVASLAYSTNIFPK